MGTFRVNFLGSSDHQNLTRIHAAFNYIPFIIPGPPSPLRQLAYEQGSPLWGPGADPAGWHECGIIKLKGSVDRFRDTGVYCTVSWPSIPVKCCISYLV